MTDHLQGSTLHRFDLSAQESDRERLARFRRNRRVAEGAPALALAGSFEGDVTDIEAHEELIGLLLDAPLPVFALGNGPFGPRGLSLLLAADLIVFGPEAAIPEDWRESPGIAPLIHHHAGPLVARRMLFDTSADLITLLTETGLAVRSPDPAEHVGEITAGLSGSSLGRRLKRTLKASSEMPLKEALNFDFWFLRTRQASAP